MAKKQQYREKEKKTKKDAQMETRDVKRDKDEDRLQRSRFAALSKKSVNQCNSESHWLRTATI